MLRTVHERRRESRAEGPSTGWHKRRFRLWVSGRARACPACWTPPDPGAFLLLFSLVRPNRAISWVARAELSLSTLRSRTASACASLLLPKPLDLLGHADKIECGPLSIPAAFRSPCNRATVFSSCAGSVHSGYGEAPSRSRAPRHASRGCSRMPWQSVEFATGPDRFQLPFIGPGFCFPSLSSDAVILAPTRASARSYRRFRSAGGGTDGMTAAQTGSPEFNM